ncbi:DUF4197 family protein [Pontixanthobacter sp.]|uniref:DUF4197 family protein n=1 Tax=Pontixanthobacter sp. TaxID=2792078 RepID=UPI003C7BBF96
MPHSHRLFGRRQVLAGAAAGAALLPFGALARAQGLDLASLLESASDGALDKLAVPGAFYGDKDVRIGLPFAGRSSGLLGSLLGAGERLGLLDGLIRTVNNAAGAAAGEAKPIFRTAISDISFSDVPGIVRSGDGGTQYLRGSAHEELHGKMTPLVDSALGDLGAYNELDALSEKHSFVRRAGLSRAAMSRTVADQGLDGIFSYMGKEERALRANPLKQAGRLLDLF